MDSSEKFITASISVSLSFNSAVTSSAKIESASVIESWEVKGVASGIGVVVLGKSRLSCRPELSVDTSVAGIGLKIFGSWGPEKVDFRTNFLK